MNNPKTEDVVEALRRCSLWKRGDCQSCPMKDVKRDEQNGVVFCAGNLMLFAADRLEVLEKELIDERYRHDRLQDFCVAYGEELSKLKARQRWIPVTERLPDIYEKDPDWSTTVLFMTSQGHVHSGYRNIGRAQKSFYDDDWTPPYWLDESENLSFEEEEVTHWAPLPEVPKEDE